MSSLSNENLVPLKVLIIEDSEDDAILLIRELKKGGFSPSYQVVDDLPSMRAALENSVWDIIITDYSMPKFSGIEAIRFVQSAGLDVPVIIVSGVVGEETAVDAMRAGAKDYLIKFNYIRLTATIRREIEEAKNRAQKRQTELELKELFAKLEAKVEERTQKLTEEIANRQKIEEDLRHSQDRLNKIFEISPAPIAITTMRDTSIIDTNDAMTALLETSREKLIGTLGTDYIVFDYPNQIQDLILKVRKEGYFKDHEFLIKTADGNSKNVLLSAEIADFGEEKWVIYLALDITDRKKADLEINSALDKERDLSALKSRFIATVSHEIRTPLTNIMLSADLLKRHGDIWEEVDRQKHIRRIQETVLKIIRLIENSLLVGKLDTEIFENRPELINVKAFIDEAISQINSAKNCADRIIVNKDELVNKEIIIDENLCGLILTNIISNAITFSKCDQNIIIDVEQIDSRLIFTVKDSGIGIAEDDKAKIFLPFYRGSNVINISGYGLGLTIAQKCAEAVGGSIKFDSKVGEGSAFTISIPYATEY